MDVTYEERAEDNADALMLEERAVDQFISTASPRKLLSIALHVQFRLIDLALLHDSVNLEEAKDLAWGLALDLASAILDMKEQQNEMETN